MKKEYPDRRYQVRLTNELNGTWSVTGYWEYLPHSWSLDGGTRNFPTRKEALDFIDKQEGIPK